MMLKKIIENMDKKVKKLNSIDMKLAQGTAMFLALIIAKLIPNIMKIDIGWFVILFILCAIKPFYVIFIKSE